VDAQRTTISGSWSQTIADRVTLTARYDARTLDQGAERTESGLKTAAVVVKAGDRVEARESREENVLDQADPARP
jgi:hypothetical protein